MTLPPLSALVIDPDPSVLSRVAGTLGHHGLRIAARLSPEESLDYIARSRPDVILLGLAFWQDGWSSEILAASPGSVVIPVVDAPAVPRTEGAA
jgi:hypothetical protein